MTTLEKRNLSIVAFDLKAQKEIAVNFEIITSMSFDELEEFMMTELERKYNTLIEFLEFTLN